MSECLEAQLDKLWDEDVGVIKLPIEGEKYVIFSDMHLGNGCGADNFRKNKEPTLRALKHYKKEKYSLILLGDIEELWQFTADEIANNYNDSVYEAIRAFGDDKVYRVFGNHDIDWKYNDPIRSAPSLSYKVYEGIKLHDAEGNSKILLIHGHQGTMSSDRYSFISRAAVMVYRYIEQFINYDRATAAPRSYVPKKFEKDRYDWAEQKKAILICGHTHKPAFASMSKVDLCDNRIDELNNQLLDTNIVESKKSLLKDELIDLREEIAYEKRMGRKFKSLGNDPAPHYFNTGCALYADGLTVIEIADKMMKLVRWDRKVINGKEFTLFQHAKLSEILKRIG